MEDEVKISCCECGKDITEKVKEHGFDMSLTEDEERIIPYEQILENPSFQDMKISCIECAEKWDEE